jgi:nickel/cobalt transporter (NicO) family protein
MKNNRQIALGCVAIVAVIIVADATLERALAQNPFGGPAAPDAQLGGIVGWLMTKQSEFYREMSSTIRAAKADGSAVWTLLAISFAYGIFHAAGPGHGKTVISSYLVANEETARRGIVLSFVSALMQSLVAILIVGIGAWLLNVTAKTMCGAERIVEIASYALIAAFGFRLVWTKGAGLIRALRSSYGGPARQLAPALARATAVHHEHPEHSHHCLAHHHDDDAPLAHGHVPGQDHAGHHHHVHTEHCGHSHGPDPAQLAGPGGWRRGLGAVLTVGIRPCSGAILVLVFALAQGLFWAGVAATFVMGLGTAITVATVAIVAISAKGLARRLAASREGGGALLMRGVEFAAAGLVLLFGVGLLLGYIAAERVTCF